MIRIATILACSIFVISGFCAQDNDLYNSENLDRFDVLPRPVGGYKGMMEKVVYPEVALDNCIEGRIIISTFIDTFGTTRALNIVEGDTVFWSSAKHAIENTSFSISYQRDRPVEVIISLPIYYRLENYAPCLEEEQLPDLPPLDQNVKYQFIGMVSLIFASLIWILIAG